MPHPTSKATCIFAGNRVVEMEMKKLNVSTLYELRTKLIQNKENVQFELPILHIKKSQTKIIKLPVTDGTNPKTESKDGKIIMVLQNHDDPKMTLNTEMKTPEIESEEVVWKKRNIQEWQDFVENRIKEFEEEQKKSIEFFKFCSSWMFALKKNQCVQYLKYRLNGMGLQLIRNQNFKAPSSEHFLFSRGFMNSRADITDLDCGHMSKEIKCIRLSVSLFTMTT